MIMLFDSYMQPNFNLNFQICERQSGGVITKDGYAYLHSSSFIRYLYFIPALPEIANFSTKYLILSKVFTDGVV